MADLRQEEGGRLAWVSLTREQVLRCQAEQEDTSDVVNDLLSIDGVRLAVLFKEMDGGRTKLSFRSKGDLDVNRLASRFSGGGHTNAAGAVLAAGLDEPSGASCHPAASFSNSRRERNGAPARFHRRPPASRPALPAVSAHPLARFHALFPRHRHDLPGPR